MDGGRVVRSFFTRVLGDWEASTRWTLRFSLVVAIFASMPLAYFWSPVAAWLLLIMCWFGRQEADKEIRSKKVKGLLDEVDAICHELMDAENKVIESDQVLQELFVVDRAAAVEHFKTLAAERQKRLDEANRGFEEINKQFKEMGIDIHVPGIYIPETPA
jgi:hypothetical protein